MNETIIEECRRLAGYSRKDDRCLAAITLEDAADEIERLRAWVAALESRLDRESVQPDWMPLALAISAVLHGKDDLQPLCWHMARGLAEELARVVVDPAQVAELSKPEAIGDAIQRRIDRD